MFVAVTWRGQGGNFIIVYKKLTTIFNSGIVMNDNPRIRNDGFSSLELRFFNQNADTFIVLVVNVWNKILKFVAVCVFAGQASGDGRVRWKNFWVFK